MRRTSNILRVLLGISLCLSIACGEPKSTEVLRPPPPPPGEDIGTDLVILVERQVERDGPYVAGATEHFKVVASNETLKSVQWSTSAGSIAPSFERVAWTLPTTAGSASLSVSVETESGRKTQGSFTFNVVAAPVAAETDIDPTPDETGRFCELAFDNSGKAHLLYSNDTHRTLWYATLDGTTWTREQVDGPGPGAETNFTWNAAMALNPVTGVPHIAYFKGLGSADGAASVRPWYATRVNGAWTTENVETLARTVSSTVSIALNPAKDQQPTLVIGDNQTTTLPVSVRTGPNAWNNTKLSFASGAKTLKGDIRFDAAGTLYIPFVFSLGTALQLGALREGQPFEYLQIETFTSATTWFPTAMGPGNHLLLIKSGSADASPGGYTDVTLGTPLSTSASARSQLVYENDATDIAYANGIFIANRHETRLELITSNARNLWDYTQWGSVQAGPRPSIAVRPTDGTPHVCYQRGGKVSFQ
ncbi:hypothetical protein LXT21_43120 [Myxococcus sp. K38C18041901]|uniref:hypothetical protein n=1 Tax=Myxococcus guangdongensis TaxID=2906760 RepID=UPI0020A80B12|nr:hypothetical protein [Myxococcus guangdongensis]MCP3065579.1 hypothetical protein [Myxococcus guangdongensis]